MSVSSFGARGDLLVSEVPPLKAQSGLGQGWLDTGVVPNVLRAFDGLLYQPGGISPTTGAAGIARSSRGLVVLDTFSGASGTHLSAHTPDYPGAAASWAIGNIVFGADMTLTGASAAQGLGSGALDTNHQAAADLFAWVTLAAVPAPASGTPLGIFVHDDENNNYIESLIAGDGTNWHLELESIVAGTPTILVNYHPGGTFVPAAGDVTLLRLEGGNYLLYNSRANGTLGQAEFNGSGAEETGAGRIGVYAPAGGALSDLVVCSGTKITIQGVRAGWAAQLVVPGPTVLAEAVASGSIITMDLFSVAGASLINLAGGIGGFLQLYTDNTYTVPVVGGRYPAIGNAPDIYPGDLYQWTN